MIYRKAKTHEVESIATLHAKSWQVAYKDILSDDFLENEVVDNRLKIWTERFAYPAENEFICVAVEEEMLKGFVCVYGNDDAEWGALIDNFYLWVYEDNYEARRFYEKMGGKNVESATYENPGGGISNTLRYAWMGFNN